jgi:hypothetical protein
MGHIRGTQIAGDSTSGSVAYQQEEKREACIHSVVHFFFFSFFAVLGFELSAYILSHSISLFVDGFF